MIFMPWNYKLSTAVYIYVPVLSSVRVSLHILHLFLSIGILSLGGGGRGEGRVGRGRRGREGRGRRGREGGRGEGG